MSTKYTPPTNEELEKIKAELEGVNLHDLDDIIAEFDDDRTYIKFHLSRKHKKFLLAGLGLFSIGAIGTLAFKKFDETHEVSFEAPQVDVTLPSVDVTAPSLEVEKKPAKKSE